MPEQKPTTGRSDAAGFAATRWTLVLAAADGRVVAPRPRGDGGALPAVLVSALCLRPPPRTRSARGRRPDPGVLSAAAGQGFPGRRGPPQRQVPRLPVGRAEAFPGQRAGPLPSPETRRREGCHLAGWSQGGKPLSVGAGTQPDTRKNSSSANGRSPSSTRSCSGCKRNSPPRASKRSFERLKRFLTADRQPGGYAEVAVELAMTEGAVKTAVHRLRRRYRQLLREEIAQTVAGPEEIDDEIRYLLACL